MSRIKIPIIAAGISAIICCFISDQSFASTTTLELTIQPAQCTVDTITVNQQTNYSSITPTECSKPLSHNTPQGRPEGITPLRNESAMLFHTGSTDPKINTPSQLFKSPTLPHSSFLQLDSQTYTSIGIGTIIVISIDILAFNMRYSQIAWRHTARTVRRIFNVLTP